MPHLKSRQAFFPSVVELDSGELVCAFDIGEAFEAVNVRSFTSHSTDDGKTWTTPEVMFNPEEDDHKFSTTCRIARVSNNRLAGLACLFDRTHEELGLVNPETDGFCRTDIALIRSFDSGYTWGRLRFINPPNEWNHWETCSHPIDLGDGRWIIPCSMWKSWIGQDPKAGMRALALISDDNGESFTRLVTVMDHSKANTASWEQKQIRLSDGRLLAVCWRYDMQAKQSLKNGYSLSTNRGDSYGAPLESPVHGETASPVALDDNHFLLVYRRVDKKGLWAQLARMEGDTWTPISDQPLWGVNTDGYGTSEGSKFQTMSTLRFGYPSVIRRKSGELFVVFWCYEDAQLIIRYVRINIA
jgi:hypothetical protein